MQTNILSFDVSSVSTGWSVVDTNSKIIDYGIIAPMDLQIEVKLYVVRQHVITILQIFNPNIILIEETYMKNVSTLKVLSQFVGVVREACFEHAGKYPIIISPNSVRSFYKVKNKKEAYKYVVGRYKTKFRNFSFERHNDITDATLQALYFIEKEETDD